MEQTSSRPPAQSPTPSLPTIALPKGGGAVRDIGEKFSANAATGTGSLTVPLASSPGRAGFGPGLTLAYDSGAGNGHFGVGWSLGVPTITRKTDKGLPRYRDADESDVFILSGSEDLVPVLDGAGERIVKPRTVHDVAYDVHFYRPRIEGLFARIERWVERATGIGHWRSITSENVTTLYGLDANSRIVDPDDPRRIFSYRICRTFDDKGNVSVYDYVAEDATGIDTAAVHETNRDTAARTAERYLKRVRFGNVQPYFADWSEHGAETPLPADWHFETVLDYGDHAPDAPAPTHDRDWAVRPDPFSYHRAGFEVRTYRRCERVLLFHSFADQDVGVNCLVRSTDLLYSDQQTPADPRNPIYTMLVSVTQAGYRRKPGGYTRAPMPPLELEYSLPQLQPDVLVLDDESGANLPEGIDGMRYRFVDLDGEALSGILTETAGAWCYKRNLSANNQIVQPDGSVATRARFAALETIAALPARTSLGAQRLMDVTGDGMLDAVALEEPDPGYYERTPDATWAPFRRFASLPQLDWSDPNLKFVDLTGDGLADVVISEDGAFTLWASRGGAAGFAPAERVAAPWDEQRGPHVVFADRTDTVSLSDMTGDGLSDLVRVRNGEVCYWPNLGYGRFGRKVTMGASPRFAAEELFDPRRVHHADIDGSGTIDLLYAGDDGVRVWFNQSGNAFAQPHRLAVFPSADPGSTVQVVDLLGNGTACLVWSSPLPSAASAPLRYVDLMGGVKPHLLTRMRNNLGAETRIGYAPSTRFYLADKQAGRPWITRLHFPVQVVERVESFDWIGRSRFVTRYVYHDGYFDGYEREFRGFGMVEQWDTEEHRDDTAFPAGGSLNWDASSWNPPVLTRTWLHTGAFAEAGVVSAHYAREYWAEPVLRDDAHKAAREAMLLYEGMLIPDSALPAHLTADQVREAYRALKGHTIRTEIFAQDGTARADRPYTVTEQNFTIVPVQPFGPNQHAVFFTHPRETVVFHYEREEGDPRVTHDIALEVDPFGNVLRNVAIAYPRRPGYPQPEPTLPATFRGMLAYDQTRMHVTATKGAFTNDLADHVLHPHVHRTPLPSESVVAELTGIAPAANVPGATNLFRFDELDTLWSTAWDELHGVPFENVLAADVDGGGPAPAAPAHRILERMRTVYRSDDFTTLLDVGVLQSGARAGEINHVALTSTLVKAIFDDKVVDATLHEGGYVQRAGGTDWWKSSGRVFYSGGDLDTPAQELDEARHHFYVARRAVDAFGAVQRITYDAYDLLPHVATDAVGNTLSAANDYRLLQPYLVTDANGNQTQAAFDTRGFVAGLAMMGKPTEALGDSLAGFVVDLDDATTQAYLGDPLTHAAAMLGNASARFVHDVFAYARTRDDPQPAPSVVATLVRETHVSDIVAPAVSRYRHTFVYGDGFGRDVQQKTQAEPGPVVDGGATVSPRWTGSGWTVRDNKDHAVRTYEPFFTATNAFEFARTAGVSTVSLYDPVGRAIAKLHPNATWEKVVFDTWRQETWDVDDTVSIGDPRTDADVGARFTRLLGTSAFTSWHDLRIGGTFGTDANDRDAQRDAALKAEANAATPAVQHVDALGRTCLTVTDAGGGARFPTRTAMDLKAKTLAVFDALGRRAYEFVRRVADTGGTRYVLGYDLAGNGIYHLGMDDGEQRTLANADGHPMRDWDALGHAFRVVYDRAQRATHRYVSAGGGGEILLERSVYGEGLPERNLCARLFRCYDADGLSGHQRYDFKGNLLESVRQTAGEYRNSVDWTPLAALTDPDALDTAASSLLGVERFTAATVYDALNRPVQTVTPHATTVRPNIVRPSYNEANLLARLDVWLQQAVAPAALLDPSTADLHVVTAAGYNARGQRVRLTLGNGTATAYTYDPETFRLARLTTMRPGTFAADQRTVQDLAYAYDPIGNVTRIHDDADTQNVVYFNNRRVDPSSDYTYDALHRIGAASGREHLGQHGGVLDPPAQIANDDGFRAGIAHPGDGKAVGRYAETYAYDAVGNLETLVHNVSSGTWTRRYAYTEPSRIEPARNGNRLSSTSVPGDPDGGPYTARYAHDAHGNMTAMPHLPVLAWDERDRLRSTTRQVVTSGTPETTYYVYDAAGERLRKVTDRQAGAGVTSTRRNERIYLGPVEVYREYAADGKTVTLQRETLHCASEHHRFALVEMRTVGTDPAPAQLVRYQYANQLGSATLELDDAAQVISYEEYFPFGSTSYQAVRSATETPKRYRYTDEERDTENNLCYHGARYYAPWLGRWTSPDPAGLVDGVNLYVYVRNNPVMSKDPNGMWTWKQVGIVTAVIAVAVVVTVATAGAGAVAVGAIVGAAELGAGTAAAVTFAGTVAVGAGSGYVSGRAADATAQVLTSPNHTVNWDQNRQAGQAGLIAGAVTGIIPGVGAARAAATAARAASTATTATRAVATAVRATTITTRAARIATTVGRGAASGALGGGTYEAARQQVSGERAAQGGFDAERIVSSAVAGGVAGGALAPVGQAIGGRIRVRVTTRQAANAAQRVNPRPAMAEVLAVGDETFFGNSQKGAGTPLHPDVQAEVDAVPTNLRSPGHGRCGLPQCISRALEAGVDPRGGVSGSRNVRAPGNATHAEPRSQCTTCRELARRYGITDVYRGRR